MTAQEKQREFANILYVRGLLTEEQTKKIVSAKFSYDIVETMIDYAAGIVDPTAARTILMKMVK